MAPVWLDFKCSVCVGVAALHAGPTSEGVKAMVFLRVIMQMLFARTYVDRLSTTHDMIPIAFRNVT